MYASKLIVAPVLFATGAVMAHGVSVDASCTPQVTPLEARLVQKAEQGPDALRQFIFIRRGMLTLDMREVADRVRSIEDVRATCRQLSSWPEIREDAPAVASAAD
jgi:hypothetical protein